MTLFPIGGGTNLIGSDTEIPDTCFVKLTGEADFAILKQDPDNPDHFICGSANSLGRIAIKALAAGYGGLSPLSGIPGTLGGAFKMNAGAMGKCLADFVVDFTVMDLQTGQCCTLKKKELLWEYRNSGLPDSQILLEARLNLQKVDPVKEQKDLEQERERRAKAPKGRSSGSIFRNPSAENPAGKILEQLSVKGLSSGSFSVSREHANWIINRSDGPNPNREQDFVLLIKHLMVLAQQYRQLQLLPEVKFINPQTSKIIEEMMRK